MEVVNMNIHDEMDEVYQTLVDNSRVIENLLELVTGLTGKSFAEIEIDNQLDVSNVLVSNDRVCEKIEGMVAEIGDERGAVSFDDEEVYSVDANEGWEYY